MDGASTSIHALVEPAVLRWARATIGLTEVAAARRIGVPDDRVTQWESGEAQPTIAQLKKAATAYNRSLDVFFLAEPPAAFDTLRDFRRLPEAGAEEWSPDLHAEYRRVHQQRGNLLELYELDDEEPPDDLRLPPGDPDERLAERARETLPSLSPLRLTIRSTLYGHVNAWGAGLERAGVLVLATSRGRVQTTEMRAFPLYFDHLPVIMVNGADSPRGRLFSLLHECAHVILHTQGLCDVTADLRATTPERQLEARCNALAASMLMPAAAVRRRPEVQARAGQQDAWTYVALRDAAVPFGASAEAFLRRLLTLGRVTQVFYEARRVEFLQVHEADAAARTTSGGDWYRNTVRDLGKGYVCQVTDAYRRRMINTYTAATYLNARLARSTSSPTPQLSGRRASRCPCTLSTPARSSTDAETSYVGGLE